MHWHRPAPAGRLLDRKASDATTRVAEHIWEGPAPCWTRPFRPLNPRLRVAALGAVAKKSLSAATTGRIPGGSTFWAPSPAGAVASPSVGI
jgi:hypothetical protein